VEGLLLFALLTDLAVLFAVLNRADEQDGGVRVFGALELGAGSGGFGNWGGGGVHCGVSINELL
jgi:hypothetical protein